MAEAVPLIRAVLGRLRGMDYLSYDPYDFWSSPAGLWLRAHRNPITLPLIGAAYYGDLLFPMLFRRGAPTTPPLETMPQLLRGMAVFHWLTGDGTFEAERGALLRELVGSMRKTEHGAGLGHPFDWHTGELIPAYTPCVPLSWNLAAYLLKDDPDGHPEALEGIGGFIHHDCNPEELGGGRCRVSYTPRDGRRVVNANAAAALALHRLGKHCGKPEWSARGERLLAYVLGEQRSDGGWWYFEKESVREKENFIDCFHSAFVLVHLLAWAEEGRPEAARAFDRGLEWFIHSFVRADGGVRHFAVSHLPVTINDDIRSCAEAIALLAQAARRRPECAAMAHRTLDYVKANLYDGAGGFYFRRYRFFTCRMNYIRWGAAPMMGALAELALSEEHK